MDACSLAQYATRTRVHSAAQIHSPAATAGDGVSALYSSTPVKPTLSHRNGGKMRVSQRCGGFRALKAFVHPMT
jgi:hypothetical protein